MANADTPDQTDTQTTEEPQRQSVWPALTGEQSYDDLQTVGKLKHLFYDARKYRRPLIDQWRKNYRILRNRTWVANRADWAPSPEVPEIYPIIATRVGWMTDQRPELEVVPAIQPHSSLANYYSTVAWDLQTTLQTAWKVYNFNSEVEKTLWDGDVYGIGFLKSTWDATKEDGLGDISMERVDPFTIYIDPQATSLSDANYIIEARTMSLQEVDRRWPGSADILEAKRSAFQEDIDTAPTRLDGASSSGPPKANPGAIAPNTSIRYGQPGMTRLSASNSAYEDKGVTVFQCWIREHYLEREPDDSYPEIMDEWRVYVIAGNRILLNESASNLWNHGRHPYSRYVPHETGELYGYSLVELLIPAQLAINRLLASFQLNLELTGNPVFLEGARSGLSRTKMTNKPGQRLSVNESTMPPSWLQPPTVPPIILQTIQHYVERMETIAGMSAITRGIVAGRQSTDTLDQSQDSALIRIRTALRNLEYTLREQGQLQASLITEFYDTPRMVAAVGANGSNSSIFLKAKHFYVPVNGSSEQAPLKFQLLINAGSQNATSAQARRQDALQLFAMGALDAQALLEIYNWPNRDDILQRIRAAQAAGLFQAPGARQRSKRTQ